MKSARKPTKLSKKSQELDARYRLLVKDLRENGFTVRREELKRGLGWRASSGTCRLFQDKLILVDRRLPAEEQVNFLEDVAKHANLAGKGAGNDEPVIVHESIPEDRQRDSGINSAME